jgi:DNA-directed RNA polymerase
MGDNAWEHREKWKAVQGHFTTDDGISSLRDACQYLAQIIMESLEHTVVAAAQAMDYLKKTASVIASTKEKVKWTVPMTNFPVTQSYMQQKQVRVVTMLLGAVYKPALNQDTDTPNGIKQANSVSPNVVHSLDAAALMLTVLDAKANGVQSFAMVHDSYGAPAGDCALLARCTRSAFIRLYSQQDVMQHLHDQFVAQAGSKEIPTLPSKGTLDLSLIYGCEFFFA